MNGILCPAHRGRPAEVLPARDVVGHRERLEPVEFLPGQPAATISRSAAGRTAAETKDKLWRGASCATSSFTSVQVLGFFRFKFTVGNTRAGHSTRRLDPDRVEDDFVHLTGSALMKALILEQMLCRSRFTSEGFHRLDIFTLTSPPAAAKAPKNSADCLLRNATAWSHQIPGHGPTQAATTWRGQGLSAL